MDIDPIGIGSKTLTTNAITMLLISATILTAAASLCPTNPGVCQLPPNGVAGGDSLLNTREKNGIPIEEGALTVVQVQGLDAQQGQTIENLKESRLVLLGGIDNAILRLYEPEPGTEPVEEFDTGLIAELLRTDQLESAIAELLELKDQVVDVFGEDGANEEVVPQIENLIGALENQKNPSPPASLSFSRSGSGAISVISDSESLSSTFG
jgi:hypothetical protein